MKKILHVAETIKGGVASVLKQLVKDNQDFDTLCIVPDSQIIEMKDISRVKLRVFNRTGRNIKSFISLLRTFIEVVRIYKPDVIHIHSSFAGFICRAALMMMPVSKNTKVIYCPHAFSFLMNVSEKKKKVYSFIERILSCNTDAIICTSEYEKKVAIQYGLNESKLFVIYNGILEPIITSEKEFIPYDINKINVLFVGRFDYQKGIDILFKIINSVGPEFHFTLVGECVQDDFVKTELPMVTYTGWVSSKELAVYYRYADVTLMPSRWESFGLVAAESNSYGTPVLASNASSLPEIIINNETGYLFNINDSNEASVILKGKTKNEWAALKESCYLNYKQKFKSEEMVEKVSELYELVFR
ncbi:TPA: glycosyltransferase [Raoultella planticola]